MAFFDELKKQVSGVAQNAQKAAEIARIQRLVNLKQDEFDALFAEIGQLYYGCVKRGEQPGEEMESRCARVDSIAAEIEGLKLKLDDLKQIRRCSKCGSIQNNESRFCAACGNKLEERVIHEDAPAEAPAAEASAAETEVDDFKNAVREELKKEFGTDESGKGVFISWPETEQSDAAETETTSEE